MSFCTYVYEWNQHNVYISIFYLIDRRYIKVYTKLYNEQLLIIIKFYSTRDWILESHWLYWPPKDFHHNSMNLNHAGHAHIIPRRDGIIQLQTWKSSVLFMKKLFFRWSFSGSIKCRL